MNRGEIDAEIDAGSERKRLAPIYFALKGKDQIDAASVDACIDAASAQPC